MKNVRITRIKWIKEEERKERKKREKGKQKEKRKRWRKGWNSGRREKRRGVMCYISQNKWSAQTRPAVMTAMVLPWRMASDIRCSSKCTSQGSFIWQSSVIPSLWRRSVRRSLKEPDISTATGRNWQWPARFLYLLISLSFASQVFSPPSRYRCFPLLHVTCVFLSFVL